MTLSLAKILSEIANLVMVGVALNQVLSSTPFHPWFFAGGIATACLFHIAALYCLQRK
jgi:hypothetical protein